MAAAARSDPRLLARKHSEDRHRSAEEAGFGPRDAAIAKEGEGGFRELSDDQAICIGYAINLPQTNYLPIEHWVARALARRLHHRRTEEPALALGPGGKVIVFIREKDAGWSLEGLSSSLQQHERADGIALHRGCASRSRKQ
jgi:S-adenosylmethionine synthetase